MTVPIETIVEAALNAPSGDNCQPFRYKWNGQELQIHHDDVAGKHFFNYSNHGSILTLGVIIEHLAMKASEFGLRIEAQYHHLGSHIQAHWASVTFVTDPQIKADPLAQWIPKRFTDRGRYRNGHLTQPQIEELNAVSLGNPYVHHIIKQQPLGSLFSLMKTNDNYFWHHTESVSDFAHLVTFSKSSTGMNWKELGINFLETFPIVLMRWFPFLISIMWKLGLKRQTETVLIKNLKSAAGLAFFFTSKPTSDLTGLIDVAREYIRFWLKLQSMGYSVQPTTTATLSYYTAVQGTLSPLSKPFYINHFRNSLPEFQRLVGVTPDKIPVWSFRFGKGNQTTRLSQRRLLSEVFELTKN